MPDIIDNAYVIVEFDNGCRGMLDLCMFAEGGKNEQEISVVGDIGKVNRFPFSSLVLLDSLVSILPRSREHNSFCFKVRTVLSFDALYRTLTG